MKTKQHKLRTLQLQARDQPLAARIASFRAMIANRTLTYKRTVVSAAGREVVVQDPFTGTLRTMLMFASNNYLGLATHPHVVQRVQKAIERFGCGVGGPPLLNGYHRLTEELEERLAAFKSQEAAMVFSSGFAANLGMVAALCEVNDLILYDEKSHASFYDGLRLSRAKALSFGHNDLAHLEILLEAHGSKQAGSVFVCTEGVFSMDGDLAPLPDMAALCRERGAMLVVDDAHGTGVLGEGGRGTASYQSCAHEVDITMGTFSKVFATCGGFITAGAGLVEYLRYHARPYVFSASLPPPVAATVLAGLEVIEAEPGLREQLRRNTAYAIEQLAPFGWAAPPQAAILALALPEGMNLEKAAYLFHQKNVFINPVEYPAVPPGSERFRISIMATHTPEDIDRLATAVAEVWKDPIAYQS